MKLVDCEEGRRPRMRAHSYTYKEGGKSNQGEFVTCWKKKGKRFGRFWVLHKVSRPENGKRKKKERHDLALRNSLGKLFI